MVRNHSNQQLNGFDIAPTYHAFNQGSLLLTLITLEWVFFASVADRRIITVSRGRNAE